MTISNVHISARVDFIVSVSWSSKARSRSEALTILALFVCLFFSFLSGMHQLRVVDAAKTINRLLRVSYQ